MLGVGGGEEVEGSAVVNLGRQLRGRGVTEDGMNAGFGLKLGAKCLEDGAQIRRGSDGDFPFRRLCACDAESDERGGGNRQNPHEPIMAALTDSFCSGAVILFGGTWTQIRCCLRCSVSPTG